jgi:hypothetical protein
MTLHKAIQKVLIILLVLKVWRIVFPLNIVYQAPKQTLLNRA